MMVTSYKIELTVIGIAVISMCASGCATPRSRAYVGTPQGVAQAIEYDVIMPTTPGVYHHVAKGETLWRIAKTYGVSLEELVRANAISDARRIKTGQRIYIPGTGTVCENSAITGEALGQSFVWPVDGDVAEFFGSESNNVTNKGIEIYTRFGEDIRAAKSGTVVYCSDDIKGYEKGLIIDHGDSFQTVYAYTSAILVSQGDAVHQSDIIARSGKPRHSGESRLHFEIRKKGKPDNPLYYLPQR